MKTDNCCKPGNNSLNGFFKEICKFLSSYKPLIIILIFCFAVPMVQINHFESQKFMYYVMGYFLIFLSLFKFLDIKGFVQGFSSYDIITKNLPIYGYIYPFIEFGLGLMYLKSPNNYTSTTNLLTLIIMLISGIGVLKTILSKQKVNCACLGTILKVPLSTISVLENFGMATMAAYNLLF